MISIEQVQEAVVDALRIDPLVNGAVGDEVRENQWQGTEFGYPAVRVDMLQSRQRGRGGTCVTTYSEVPFNVIVFSEESSSQEANRIAGLVVNALLDHQLVSGDFFSGFVRMGSGGQGSARRATERVWRAVTSFEVNIYET